MFCMSCNIIGCAKKLFIWKVSLHLSKIYIWASKIFLKKEKKKLNIIITSIQKTWYALRCDADIPFLQNYLRTRIWMFRTFATTLLLLSFLWKINFFFWMCIKYDGTCLRVIYQKKGILSLTFIYISVGFFPHQCHKITFCAEYLIIF